MLHHMLRAAAQRAFSTLDPYFKYVTMLLHGDGSALGSDTVTPFNSDASTNAFNVTINGDARSNNFNPYQAGYYSNYFSSNSGLTAPNNSAFKPATNDFTVEAWIFSTSTGQQIVYGDSDSATNNGVLDLYLTSSGFLASDYWTSSTAVTTRTSTLAPTINQWNHVLVSRTGTTMYIGLNGVLQSFTAPSSYQSPATIYPTVGRLGAYAAGVGFIGYISNFRFINGTNLYSGSTYTVPTAPLTAVTNTSLLTCQSNRFIDNSTNNFTLTVNGTPQVAPAQPFTLPSSVATYGSGYFDGSGDYLAPATSSAFAYGTGDLTFECWIYVSSASDAPIYESRSTNSNTDGFTVTAFSSTVIRVYTNGVLVTATVPNYLNAWTHVAYTRQGSTNRLFVNGVLGATATASDNFSNTTAFIGAGRYASSSISAYFTGYISDVRILKGTAQYTSSFTPPTAPLTAITNTSLLTTQYNGAGNNNGFKDSSQNNFTITRNGNTTQGTFTPYGSNWSIYSDGSGDSVTAPSNTAFAFGTGDFTVEFWAYIPSWTNEAQLIGAHTAFVGLDWLFQQWNSGEFRWLDSSLVLQSGYVPPTNQWNHYACTRSGTTLRIFVNGVQRASGTSTANIGSTKNVGMLGDTSGLQSQIGYMSNVRIVKGTALYTSAFTPSTTPLTAISGTSLLTCQSNRFIDNSTNNFTLTVNGNTSVQRFSPFSPTTAYSTSVIGGSGYFDGSGDYLTAPSNAAFGFGTGDFTVECWVNPSSQGGHGSSNNDCIIDFRPNTGGGAYGTLYIYNNGTGVYWYANTANQITGGAIKNNAWTHLVVSRVSGSTRLFINGVQSGSTYADSTNYATGIASIAQFSDGTGGGYFNGYMSDVRVVKGSGVTSVTVPTAPLTAISGTSLLLSYTNAGILDNAMMNDLETVGNAQISTSVKKYGTGSIIFDATDDRLVSASSPNIAFGTGDFTVEFWLNSNNVSSANQRGVIQTSDTAGGLKPAYTTGIAIYQGGNASGGALSGGLTANVGGTFLGSSSAVITTGTWYHIALVRSSGTSTIYVNGTSVGSATTTGNCSGQNICVGGYYDTTYLYSGYIDDLRITKGVARYTANFTAPTAAFPNN